MQNKWITLFMLLLWAAWLKIEHMPLTLECLHKGRVADQQLDWKMASGLSTGVVLAENPGSVLNTYSLVPGNQASEVFYAYDLHERLRSSVHISPNTHI